jgi:hypothetical protein
MDLQKSFYGLVECHKYKNETSDNNIFHPLSYEHLELVQMHDPQSRKNLYKIPLVYFYATTIK